MQTKPNESQPPRKTPSPDMSQSSSKREEIGDASSKATSQTHPEVGETPPRVSQTRQRGSSGLLSRLWRLPAIVLISIARFYQICISPLLPAVCRFQPTCSSYFIQSVQKYGAIKGSFKGVMRICRCHPWGGCGHDPP